MPSLVIRLSMRSTIHFHAVGLPMFTRPPFLPPMIHSGWFSVSHVFGPARSGSNHSTKSMPLACARSEISRIPLGNRVLSTSQVPASVHQFPVLPGYQPASMK